MQLGRDERLLLGAQEHQVPAMVREIARVGGLVALIDRAIGVERAWNCGGRRKPKRAELFALGEVVEDHGGGRAGLARARGLSAASPSASTQPLPKVVE